MISMNGSATMNVIPVAKNFLAVKRVNKIYITHINAIEMTAITAPI
jgi:hypothetical protein